MILKNKYNSDGTLERKKGRLVAQGYSQLKNVDYTETFAPVAKLSTIRLLLAMAMEEKMKIQQLDVTTAYLNREIDTAVYMQKPTYLDKFVQEIMVDESENQDDSIFKKAKQMLEDIRKGKNDKVCLLKKAIYGLKQAGRQWYKKLDEKLQEVGFQPSAADPCMYVRSSGGVKTLIAVYVDDLLLATASDTDMKETKQTLQRIFDMRDLGNLHYCLGIEFDVNDNYIAANQQKFITELLYKFNMDKCKSASTPMEAGLKLLKSEKLDENLPYQNLIGSLMYLSVATRPDISYAISYLSQYNSCYSNEHWTAAKRVLRYLQGSKDLTLTFRKTGQPIQGMADADWAACTQDRRSYTGYVFTYGGAAISWESRKQRTVALSTAEAEYMALTDAAKEAIHLKQLSADMGLRTQTIVIFNDNQAAQNLAVNPVISSKSKHISIKEHFIRDAVSKNDVKLEYRPTKDMEADILTKSLCGPKHRDFRTRIGIIQRSHP